jgi:hypothetical protein
MFAHPLVVAVRGSQTPVKILDVAVDATSVHHNTPDLLISAKENTAVVFTMELEVCLYGMHVENPTLLLTSCEHADIDRAGPETMA